LAFQVTSLSNLNLYITNSHLFPSLIFYGHHAAHRVINDTLKLDVDYGANTEDVRLN